jgi:hypothetical protein
MSGDVTFYQCRSSDPELFTKDPQYTQTVEVLTLRGYARFGADPFHFSKRIGNMEITLALDPYSNTVTLHAPNKRVEQNHGVLVDPQQLDTLEWIAANPGILVRVIEEITGALWDAKKAFERVKELATPEVVTRLQMLYEVDQYGPAIHNVLTALNGNEHYPVEFGDIINTLDYAVTTLDGVRKGL